MIKKIDFRDKELVKELFLLQKLAYKVEADLIGFPEIPALMESIEGLQNCGEEFLGFFEDKDIVGAASYTVEGGVADICRMVVHPGHFRKGIACELLKAVEQESGCLRYSVSTGRDNAPAIGLYLKNGYNWSRDVEIGPNFFMSFFEKEVS
jgi:ribosomal protein S18 acetylase RimI-like enzyme